MRTERTNLPPLLRRGTLALLCAALALPLLMLTPKADAQVTFSLRIGTPPVCPYGYYEYSPYSCAPPGFYGPGYFYNGIFLGVGPWANWGYTHGWGRHRFVRAYGGRYYRGYWRSHRHLRASHYWDHPHPRGHAYGYYRKHDRREYYRHDDHGHYDHHDHGHGGDRDHGHGDHDHGHGHHH